MTEWAKWGSQLSVRLSQRRIQLGTLGERREVLLWLGDGCCSPCFGCHAGSKGSGLNGPSWIEPLTHQCLRLQSCRVMSAMSQKDLVFPLGLQHAAPHGTIGALGLQVVILCLQTSHRDGPAGLSAQAPGFQSRKPRCSSVVAFRWVSSSHPVQPGSTLKGARVQGCKGARVQGDGLGGHLLLFFFPQGMLCRTQGEQTLSNSKQATSPSGRMFAVGFALAWFVCFVA